MKKIVLLLLVFLFTLPLNAFAHDGKVNEVVPEVEITQDFESLPKSITVEGDYVCVDDDLALQSVDGEVGPLSTCSGDGGYARIEPAFGLGGAVRWEVNPRFSTVHFFTGTLVISRYINGLPTPYDTVSLGLPKGEYSVSIIGSARDASQLFSWYVPPCVIGLNV
ncbi:MULTISPECIES: hypothetical protein [unclassified Paenibacillus]|uniref:hypothetical protein n=1 Tax=unclassified Paenibacillus TaxID=185978 RepID=UPI0008B945BC|nr:MULTISPECIES: hypothetical protein [unclassified Paenibacillus]QLG37433.1 hypothetical protein HW560_04420 [Paenibacillus sp. E222]SEP26011.1 hypothetical protein SAMN05518670_6240 [Paenibacillus sp. OK076]